MRHERTSVWIAYDNDALYFAFRCFDEEPSKVRTTITRRDNASRLLIRGIAQFDSAKHRVLGDFLASYELMPGTARALFFKVSYLARL